MEINLRFPLSYLAAAFSPYLLHNLDAKRISVFTQAAVLGLRNFFCYIAVV